MSTFTLAGSHCPGTPAAFNLRDISLMEIAGSAAHSKARRAHAAHSFGASVFMPRASRTLSYPSGACAAMNWPSLTAWSLPSLMRRLMPVISVLAKNI